MAPRVARFTPAALNVEAWPSEPVAIALTVTGVTLSGASVITAPIDSSTVTAWSIARVGQVVTLTLTGPQTTLLDGGRLWPWHLVVDGRTLVAGHITSQETERDCPQHLAWNLTVATTVVTLDFSGVGPAGPPGTPGPAGGSALKTAAVAIGGHRAVAFRSDGQIEYANNLTDNHKHVSVGVTTGAVAAGDTVTVLSLGEITETSWAWTPSQLVFIGPNGVLTQTPPTAPAWLRAIGAAVTPTTLFVNPLPAYALT